MPQEPFSELRFCCMSRLMSGNQRMRCRQAFFLKSVSSICSNSGKAMGGESAEKSKFLNTVQLDFRRGLAACMK